CCVWFEQFVFHRSRLGGPPICPGRSYYYSLDHKSSSILVNFLRRRRYPAEPCLEFRGSGILIQAFWPKAILAEGVILQLISILLFLLERGEEGQRSMSETKHGAASRCSLPRFVRLLGVRPFYGS